MNKLNNHYTYVLLLQYYVHCMCISTYIILTAEALYFYFWNALIMIGCVLNAYIRRNLAGGKCPLKTWPVIYLGDY